MKSGKHRNGRFVTTVYRYDPVAREMTCDFGGATNVYRYDADGKLLAVSIPGEGWATYSYNALGQNDAVTLPGGTRRTLAYDAFGRLASQSAFDGGGNALLAQAYQRSLTGRLETKATDAGVWKYGYDLTDQVTNAVLSASASDGAWGYAYDAMGNRKTASELSASSGTSALSVYSANRLNQYTVITNFAGFAPWRETSLAYDLNGNMTWDGTNAYFWDLQNQLVLVSNSQFQVSNSYDAMGRRVRKMVSRRDAETQSWNVESTHHFFYDGWNLVAEIGSRSSVVSTNRYVWGNDLSGSLQGAGGVGGLLAVTTVNGEPGTSPTVSTYYPLFDHNGNVERYVSRSGATVATFQYDAFGNTVAQSGEMADAFAYRFSTKYWDAETGLYYYGYRFYRPRLERWVNRDPIGEYYEKNLYAFVGNSTLNMFDDTGLKSKPNPGSRQQPYFRPPPPRIPVITQGLPTSSLLLPTTPAGNPQEGLGGGPQALLDLLTQWTNSKWHILLEGRKVCGIPVSPVPSVQPPATPEIHCPYRCCVVNILRENAGFEDEWYTLINAYVSGKSCSEVREKDEATGTISSPTRIPDTYYYPMR